MKKVASIFVFVSIFLSSVSLGYTDLSNTYWGYKYIDELSQKNIITGYPDGTFKPENKITRAEFITILIKTIYPNIDVKQDTDYWAEGSIEVAKDKGILKLEEYSFFNPDEIITRREICRMLYRSIDGIKNIDIENKKEFIDLTMENKEEYNLVLILNHLGILNGYPDGTIKLNNNSSRAELTCFIHNFIHNKLNITNMINNNEIIAYDGDIAYVNINELPNNLKKWRNSKDISYVSTKIKEINMFEFNNPDEKYKKIFEQFNNNEDLYLKYRKKFGENNYVIAIEFDTSNNTDKLETYCGHEFLHIGFLEQNIEILDSFDTDEISRQIQGDASTGKRVVPGETQSTSAFYIVDSLPERIRIDRDITTAYNKNTNQEEAFQSFHSLIVDLKEEMF